MEIHSIKEGMERERGKVEKGRGDRTHFGN